MLAALSAPDSQGDASRVSIQAVTYPTRVSHQAQASPLIAQVSNTNPQSWLKTLTE